MQSKLKSFDRMGFCCSIGLKEYGMVDLPDTETELNKAIDRVHPVISGRNDLFEMATDMVEKRHSESSLINLVNFLLHKIEKAEGGKEKP